MKNKILFAFLLLFLSGTVYAAGEDDPAVLYNKGIDYYEQDKFDESIATFKKAIALEPGFYEAYYNLARVQESAGKTQDAMATYEKLLQIEPTDYESVYQYAQLLYKKSYLSKALSYLAKIPADSQYYSKASLLSSKIKKRQEELAVQSQIKAKQTLRSSVVGSVPAPSGLVIDNNGNMYVASFSENKIIKISKDGQTKTVFADKTKGVDGPIGLAIDSYSNIYVANYNQGNVTVFDKNAVPAILMFAKKPYGINIDENNKKIYVTEQENNSVISYDISDILSKSAETKQKTQVQSEPVRKVLTTPVSDGAALGTPSIIESNFTRTNPQTSITSPIMIPSGDLY